VNQARARVVGLSLTIAQAEREIDAIVYQLFDLAPDEINLINAANPSTA
jgi:hypothetical protein